MRQFTIVGVIFAALFSSAVRLPAQSCPVLSAPIGQACKQHCCTNKTCCAESEKNKSGMLAQPAVKDTGSAQQVLAIAPAIAPLFLDRPLSIEYPKSAVAETTARAPSRLAVLCTFLI
jgi:hypothetical protein